MSIENCFNSTIRSTGLLFQKLINQVLFLVIVLRLLTILKVSMVRNPLNTKVRILFHPHLLDVSQDLKKVVFKGKITQFQNCVF